MSSYSNTECSGREKRERMRDRWRRVVSPRLLVFFYSKLSSRGTTQIVWTKNETRRMRQTESDTAAAVVVLSARRQRLQLVYCLLSLSLSPSPSLTSGERNMNDAGGNCEEGGSQRKAS